MTTHTPCPTWCEGAHDDDGDHHRDVYSGPGPGGTAHIDLIQSSGQPIEIQLALEFDDSEHLDSDNPPEPTTDTYTSAAARALADLARLDPELSPEEFADALEEAATLVDTHQDPDARVPHVPVPVPTRVWVAVQDAAQAPLPRPWT